MSHISSSLEHSELGKQTTYESQYNPSRLFAIPRQDNRLTIGIDSKNLPFYGFDIWNHYEVSWLNSKGKPQVAFAQIYYNCDSPNIVESKALKLYFNSFNNTQFDSLASVEKTAQQDLENVIGAAVTVTLTPLHDVDSTTLTTHHQGNNIDGLDIECDVYTVQSNYLKTSNNIVTETLFSNLLKSNCPITGQPDWGSIEITYTGPKIEHEGLLKYIVSYRNHNEFHEQCIERIFMDVMQSCQPEKLTVAGHYIRRGGIDINPIRTTDENIEPVIGRLPRQ